MWDFNYRINGTALSDYMSMVRIIPEMAAPLRPGNHEQANREGEFSELDKVANGFDIILEGDMRYTDAAGTVTHPNGGAGHIYENHAAVLALLMDTTSRRYLQRDHPHHGDVEIPFEVFAAPTTTDPRHRLNMILHAIEPYWRDLTPRTGLTPPTITILGDAPTNDAVITFDGLGTDQRFTHTPSGDYIEIPGNPGAATVVDVGAGTVLRGGNPVKALTNAAPFIRFTPGANACTLSGGGAITVDVYDKRR